MMRWAHGRTIITAAMAAAMAAAAAGGGCGGKAGAPTTIGSHAGGAVTRGPAMVFVAIGDDKLFEAACHQCDPLRERLAGQVVSSGDATFRITGTVSDECDASGPTDVLGVARLSGDPDKAPLGIAVLPAGAAVGLVEYPVQEHGFDEDVGLRAALARRIHQDLGADDVAFAPEDIVIEQVIEVNVAGDPRPETLIAANLLQADGDGPGYRWSGLVMARGGDLGELVTLWQSDLEHLVIDASYDLEGDGVRDLIYSAAYYEGNGRGAATVTGDRLDIVTSWGCGA